MFQSGFARYCCKALRYCPFAPPNLLKASTFKYINIFSSDQPKTENEIQPNTTGQGKPILASD